MAHLLRSSPDDLGALVAATADALGLDTALVEKDYWVTEVLRSVARPLDLPAPPGGAEAKVSVVFKGGTSLSKVYRLIERFSEDVDVLVVTHPAVGKARADATLRRLCDRVGDDLAIADTVDGAYPKTGLKRDRRYHYPARYQAGVVTTGVLLELNCIGSPQPNTIPSRSG